MSPMILPDKILARFPTFKSFLAGADPLRDDGFKFAYQLFKLGKDVSIVEYKNMPHGFLNFDVFPFMAEESNKAIKQSAMMFKFEMTKSQSKKFEFWNDSDTDDASNHVVYKDMKLNSEAEIVSNVSSEVSLFTKALNKVTLPFLKLFF